MKTKSAVKILVPAAVVAALLMLWLVPGTKSAGKKEIVRRVQPQRGEILQCVQSTGTVQPQNRLEIKPPVGGRIEEVPVKEGQPVRRGEILALMSSNERAALLDAARARDAETLRYWQEVYRPTALVAPIDGTVIVRGVEPGQSVTQNDAVLVLSDRLIVQADVDETDIGRVHPGQSVRIVLDAYPDNQYSGTVDKISYESKIVNNVTTYRVDIVPERVDEVFRSGMSANVRIVELKKKDALLVPQEAVSRLKSGTFVWVEKNGRPDRRAVTLGLSDESNAEVLSGLEGGETLRVVSSGDKLSSKTGTGNPLMPFGNRRRN